MSDEKSEMWGIIDLFGHVKIAGQIGDYALGGESFVRVDVPAVEEIPAHTRLFGKGAIYSISFTGQEIAEAAARRLRSTPVSVYDFDPETRSRLMALKSVTVKPSAIVQDDDDGEFTGTSDPDDNDY